MSFTIDVHHHILPDFFWRATNGAHIVGGFVPTPWSKEMMLSYKDDAGTNVVTQGEEGMRNARIAVATS
jgi:aminocarboxymuconate-semialdehyde decarboxylase